MLLVALVVVQLAVIAGLQNTSTWVEATGADLWVIRTGSGVYANSKPISTEIQDAVADVDGVGAVVPATTWAASLVQPGREATNVILNGWESGALDLDVVEGREPAGLDEIVVDAGFAQARGFDVGDRTTLSNQGNDREVEIVGTADGASLLVFQNMFATPDTVARFIAGTDRNDDAAEDSIRELDRLADRLRDSAQRLRDAVADFGIFPASRTVEAIANGLDDTAASADSTRESLTAFRQGLDPSNPTYLALEVDVGTDPAVVLARVAKEVDDVEVYTPTEFRADIESSSVGPFMPVFFVLAVAAVLVGTLVLGMTLSIMVSESMRDYAVLRAVGFTRRDLRRTVLGEGTVLVGSALVLGLILGFGVVFLARLFMPLLPTQITVIVVVGVVITSAVMLVLATLAPIRRIQRVDPASVFRA